MNIGVYVTSNYSNYDKLSKMLTSYIRKYTTSPVILTASSPSTKPNHGNLLVKRYAAENRIRCKVYETEWNKWKKSAGSIASYHMNHNSERSLVFWDGLSKGCRNYLLMTKRLRRPCDLIRVNPNDGVEVEPKEPVIKEPIPTASPNQNGVQPANPQGNQQQNTVSRGGSEQQQSSQNVNQTQNQNTSADNNDKNIQPKTSTTQSQPTNTQQPNTQPNGTVGQMPQPTNIQSVQNQQQSPNQEQQVIQQLQQNNQGQVIQQTDDDEKELPESEQTIGQLTGNEPIEKKS